MATRQRALPLSHNRYLRKLSRDRNVLTSARVRWAVLGILAALYAAHFLGGDRGLVRRVQLEKELEETRSFNAFLASERADLLRELDLRENNPLSLEKAAREKFWMAYEDELIYRFEDDDVVPELSPDGRELWAYPVADEEVGEVVEMELP